MHSQEHLAHEKQCCESCCHSVLLLSSGCALLRNEKLFFKKELFHCLIPQGSENAREQQEDKGKEQRAWQDRENEKE